MATKSNFMWLSDLANPNINTNKTRQSPLDYFDDDFEDFDFEDISLYEMDNSAVEKAAYQINKAGSSDPVAITRVSYIDTPYGTGLSAEEIEEVVADYPAVAVGFDASSDLNELEDADSFYNLPEVTSEFDKLEKRIQEEGMVASQNEIISNVGQMLGTQMSAGESAMDLMSYVSTSLPVSMDTISLQALDEAHDVEDLDSAYIQLGNEITTGQDTSGSTRIIEEIEARNEQRQFDQVLDEIYATEGARGLSDYLGNADNYNSGELDQSMVNNYMKNYSENIGINEQANEEFSLIQSSVNNAESNLLESVKQDLPPEIENYENKIKAEYGTIPEISEEEIPTLPGRPPRETPFEETRDSYELSDLDPEFDEGINTGYMGDAAAMREARRELGLTSISEPQSAAEAASGLMNVDTTNLPTGSPTLEEMILANELAKETENIMPPQEAMLAGEKALPWNSNEFMAAYPETTQDERWQIYHGRLSTGQPSINVATPTPTSSILTTDGLQGPTQMGMLGGLGNPLAGETNPEKVAEMQNVLNEKRIQDIKNKQELGYPLTAEEQAELDIFESNITDDNLLLATPTPTETPIPFPTETPIPTPTETPTSAEIPNEEEYIDQLLREEIKPKKPEPAYTEEELRGGDVFSDPEIAQMMEQYYPDEKEFDLQKDFNRFILSRTAPGSPTRKALSRVQSPLMQQYYLSQLGGDAYTTAKPTDEGINFADFVKGYTGQGLSSQNLRNTASEIGNIANMSATEFRNYLEDESGPFTRNQKKIFRNVYAGEGGAENRKELARFLTTQKPGGGMYGGIVGSALSGSLDELYDIYQAYGRPTQGNFLQYYLNNQNAGISDPSSQDVMLSQFEQKPKTSNIMGNRDIAAEIAQYNKNLANMPVVPKYSDLTLEQQRKYDDFEEVPSFTSPLPSHLKKNKRKKRKGLTEEEEDFLNKNPLFISE